METDSYDNPLTTTSSAASAAFDDGARHILQSTYGAREAFEAAVKADPGFALGHVGVARGLMAEARSAEAKAAWARASELASGVTDRERDHIAIIGLVLEGKSAAARSAVRAYVRDYPRDPLIAQLCASVFGLIAFSGEVAHEEELLTYTTQLLPHYGEDWWMLTAHAISLCETGQIAASQAMMDRALELNPLNANAAHFKAHGQYEAGETAAGRAFLDDWAQGYDRRGNLTGHLTWHIALWALQDGDTEAMWHAIEGTLRPGAPQLGGALPINTLTDMVSLLHRAALAGHAVPNEMWAMMSRYASEHFPLPGQSFADLHAALAHAMAGEGERLAILTETTNGFAGDLVAPVARAFGAVARGNWEDALNDLARILPEADRFGGSRAQRDLVELSHAQVLLRLGHTEEARRALKLRRPVIGPRLPLAA